MKLLLNLFSFCFFAGTTLVFGENSTYMDGDLIFHESSSQQSKAIQEATGSRWSHVGILFSKNKQWYVAEAVQPVRVTPLHSFLKRGKNRDYRVYRLPGLSFSDRKRLRAEVSVFMGKNYDIYFEWSDETIYCSELVYKVFFAATGIEIGVIQQFRDLKISGPYVKALIRHRLKNTWRTLNLNEPIVTPVSQIKDKKLELIEGTD